MREREREAGRERKKRGEKNNVKRLKARNWGKERREKHMGERMRGVN